MANVSALDKQQRSFQSVTSPTAVKQDLVISAYKPVENSVLNAPRDDIENSNFVWRFIDSHLSYLPVFKKSAEGAELSSREMLGYFMTDWFHIV